MSKTRQKVRATRDYVLPPDWPVPRVGDTPFVRAEVLRERGGRLVRGSCDDIVRARILSVSETQWFGRGAYRLEIEYDAPERTLPPGEEWA